MFIKLGFIKRKLISLSFMIFNFLENNGRADFSINGEALFLEKIFLLFKKDKIKRIVFDIGANVGEYSKMVQIKSIDHNVDIDLHLFEPTKSCFEVVERELSGSNVRLNNFGASKSNTIATIYFDEEKSGLASLYQRNLECYNLKLDKSEEIELRRLDEYIKQKKIDHIDLVKIDIEGHELSALEGFGEYMNGNFIDYIQFEYGGANLDSHTSLMDLYHFFNSKGFSLAKIMPNGLHRRKYSPYMDNFQYSNYVAVSDGISK